MPREVISLSYDNRASDAGVAPHHTGTGASRCCGALMFNSRLRRAESADESADKSNPTPEEIAQIDHDAACDYLDSLGNRSVAWQVVLLVSHSYLCASCRCRCSRCGCLKSC